MINKFSYFFFLLEIYKLSQFLFVINELGNIIIFILILTNLPTAFFTFYFKPELAEANIHLEPLSTFLLVKYKV